MTAAEHVTTNSPTSRRRNFTPARILLIAVVVLLLVAMTVSHTVGGSPHALPDVPDEQSALYSQAESLDELLMIDAYASFSEMANAQDDDGWFGWEWWRGDKENQYPVPHNARHQELVRILAYFFTSDAEWNRYRGDAAVEARLVAGVDYYLSLQAPEGGFPIKEAGVGSYTNTAFALEHLGGTFRLLEKADAWPTPTMREEVLEALDDAAAWALSTETAWSKGSIQAGSNQQIALLAGIAHLLPYLSETATALFDERMDLLIENMASAAGFLWEGAGADFGYTNGVGLLELASLYTATRDARLVEVAQNYARWLGRNALLQPDGAYLINSGIGTRMVSLALPTKEVSAFGTFELASLLGASKLDAFLPSREAYGEFVDALRDTTEVAGMTKPNFSPARTVMVSEMLDLSALPTADERARAQEWLPYLQNGDRTYYYLAGPEREHTHTGYLYVQRANYYTAATWGGGANSSHTMSAGTLFLHSPAAGTFIMSQRGNNTTWQGMNTFWGLVDGSFASSKDEMQRLDPGVEPTTSQTIPSDGADFTLRLTSGRKTGPRYYDYQAHRAVTYGENLLTLRVRNGGSFTERVPLTIRPDDEVTIIDANGEVTPVADDTTRIFEARTIQIERTVDGCVHTFRLTTGDPVTGVLHSSIESNAQNLPGLTTRHWELEGEDELVYSLAIRPSC